MANSANLSEAQCQEAQILLEDVAASNESIKGRYDLLVSTHSKLSDHNTSTKAEIHGLKEELRQSKLSNNLKRF